MTFDGMLKTIREAKMLSNLTHDVMFDEAIKVLSPILAEEPDMPLTIQQQTALTYVSRSMEQYHALFGRPSVPDDAA
jgi:hypothetical protein